MIKHTIYPDRGYAYISVEGNPSLEQYIAGARALGSDPDFTAETHRVCDFTKADNFEFSTQELLAFSKETLSLPMAKTAKTAFVADTAGKAGLLKLFASQFDQKRFQVFKTRQEAILFTSRLVPQTDASQTSEQIRTHRFSGKITRALVTKTNAAWFEHPDFQPDTPVMWDLRDAEFVESLPEMEQFGREMFELTNKVRASGRTALLITTTYQQVVLQHCFRQSMELGRTKLFKSESAARQWLTESL